MNESQLRDRLAAHAATTTTDRVAAWDRISAGRRRTSVARRLMPVGALALGVAAVVLAVSIAGDGSRVTATSPAAANLPNRPPAIEGSVYGLMSDRGCGSDACQGNEAGRLDLPDKTLVQVRSDPRNPLLDVQFANGALWGWQQSGQRTAGLAIGPIVGSRVEPVAGLKGGFGDSSGFAVANDGRIAWTTYRDLPSPRRELHVYDPKTGRTTTIFSTTTTSLGGLTFGPSGEIAVIEFEKVMDRPRVLIVARDGSTRRIEIEGGDLTTVYGDPTVTWSSIGLLAISPARIGHGYGNSYIIDAKTGKSVRTIKNGHAQAWSPDGTGLLVVRRTASNCCWLTLAYGPGLAREKDLGPLPDALTLRSWVPPESPKVRDGTSYPLWPEHTAEGARAAEAQGQQPWRTDPNETALHFAREVLGWTNARSTGSRKMEYDSASHTIAVSITNGKTDGEVFVERWTASYYSVSAAGSSRSAEESFGVQVTGRRVSIGITDFGTPKTEVTVWYGDRLVTQTFGPKPAMAEFTLPFEPDVPAMLLILWRDGANRVVEFATAGWPAGDFSAG
jgi:hypothetical protein